MQLRQLLVVITPHRDEQPALLRARWLAQQTGAAIELLLAEHHPGFEQTLLLAPEIALQARDTYLKQQQERLEQLAAPLRDEGLNVSCSLRWGQTLVSHVLERVEQLQPDLVLKSARHHGLLSRLLLGNSSWQLLRHCPVPVWLVQREGQQPKRLCAALDPTHSADKPAALEHELILASRELSEKLGLEADYLHCFAPLPHSLMFDAELVIDYPGYVAQTEKAHREALTSLCSHYSLPQANTHLLSGFAEQVIPDFVREQHIDLLVMGAISRSQLDSALIGHTAERVLEAVDCDLLVMKPPAFAEV